MARLAIIFQDLFADFVVPCVGRPSCVRPTSLSPQGSRVPSLSSGWPQKPQACWRSGYEGKEYEQVERELKQSSPPAQKWGSYLLK